MRVYALLLVSLLFSACAAPAEQSPMQQYLNRVAAAEIVMRDCPAYGGYEAFAAMRVDASKNRDLARQLGASEADVDAARKFVNQQYASTYILVGQERSCHELVKRLGWAGSTPIS